MQMHRLHVARKTLREPASLPEAEAAPSVDGNRRYDEGRSAAAMGA